MLKIILVGPKKNLARRDHEKRKRERKEKDDLMIGFEAKMMLPEPRVGGY